MAQGTVKFFNSSKRFGFLTPDDGGTDVFVHISAVQAAGLTELNAGDVVRYQLEPDRRGALHAAVNLVRLHAASPRAAGVNRSSARLAVRRKAGSGEGVVKWFNADKGFGFITPASGDADVFVHARTVQRSGIFGLREGQAIRYDLERDERTGRVSAERVAPA